MPEPSQAALLRYAEAAPIEGYGPDFYRLKGAVLPAPCLIAPDGAGGWAAWAWGGLDDIESLTALAGRVDVILLGTGATIAYPPRPLREALEALGVGVDPMASLSAAKQFNLLAFEGRRVAVALLAAGA